jgi:hypothetical protein
MEKDGHWMVPMGQMDFIMQLPVDTYWYKCSSIMSMNDGTLPRLNRECPEACEAIKFTFFSLNDNDCSSQHGKTNRTNTISI